MKKLVISLCFSALTTFSMASSAQKISIGHQGNSSVNKPGHGLSMEIVEQKFGQPLEQVAAKGNPPIVRWVYEEFTVYFEGNIVIHSVTNKK